MTEFSSSRHTCALTGHGRVSYVHRTCRTQSNRRRTFRHNPLVTHSDDSVTNMMHLVKCVGLLHDSLTGVNESSQKDKLVSELGVGL